MPNYKVRVREIAVVTYHVKAKSKADAEENYATLDTSPIENDRYCYDVEDVTEEEED